MSNFLENSVKINTSSMTTEELEQFRNKLLDVVDTLTHEIRVRKMCEHKHRYNTSN